MRMLASLLPGLRNLRAPLAAGFLWLTVIWVCVAPQIPENFAATKGLEHDLYRLGSAAGKASIAAALVFGAYILGVIATALSRRFLGRPLDAVRRVAYALKYWSNSFVRWTVRPRPGAGIGSAAHRITSPLTRFFAVGYGEERAGMDAVFDEAYALVIRTLSERMEADETFAPKLLMHMTTPAGLATPAARQIYKQIRVLTDSTPPDQPSGYVDMALQNPTMRRPLFEALISIPNLTMRILVDLSNVPNRIVERHPKAYERYDQTDSEADFRWAAGPPLLALPCALLATYGYPWPLLIPMLLPGLILLIQGAALEVSTRQQMLSVIADEPTASPALTRVRTGTLPWTEEPFRWHRRLLVRRAWSDQPITYA